MNSKLIKVTFSNGVTREFLSGKAALNYATKRGLTVRAVAS